MSKHQRMAEVFRDFWVCLTQPRTECPGPHPDSFQRRRLHSLSGQRVSLLCHLHSAQEKNKRQSCNFDKIGDYRMKFYEILSIPLIEWKEQKEPQCYSGTVVFLWLGTGKGKCYTKAKLTFLPYYYYYFFFFPQ